MEINDTLVIYKDGKKTISNTIDFVPSSPEDPEVYQIRGYKP